MAFQPESRRVRRRLNVQISRLKVDINYRFQRNKLLSDWQPETPKRTQQQWSWAQAVDTSSEEESETPDAPLAVRIESSDQNRGSSHSHTTSANTIRTSDEDSKTPDAPLTESSPESARITSSDKSRRHTFAASK